MVCFWMYSRDKVFAQVDNRAGVAYEVKEDIIRKRSGDEDNYDEEDEYLPHQSNNINDDLFDEAQYSPRFTVSRSRGSMIW